MIAELQRNAAPGSLGPILEVSWGTDDGLPWLTKDARCQAAIQALHRALKRTDFGLIGFVILPERFHALVFPRGRYADRDRLLHEFVRWQVSREAAHNSDSVRSSRRAWSTGNPRVSELESLADAQARLELLHSKPVMRGLAANPWDWRWSSYRFHRGLSGEPRFHELLYRLE